MRSAAVLPLALLVVLGAPAAAQAGACSSKGAELEVETAYGRIFNKVRDGERRFYVCSNNTGEKWLLTREDDRTNHAVTISSSSFNNAHYAGVVRKVREDGVSHLEIVVVSAYTGRQRLWRRVEASEVSAFSVSATRARWTVEGVETSVSLR